MNKKYLGIAAVLVLVIAGVGIMANNTPTDNSNNLENKLEVAASFYPLYFFSQEIGGDKVFVRNITPAGAEPHEYELTARDVVNIEGSALLVVNGAGLEPWADKVKPKSNLVIIAGEQLASESIEEEGEEIIDPHVWLSPVLAAQMIDIILSGFIAMDAENSAYYEANAERLKSELGGLDAKFKLGLSNCVQSNIVTSHAAFGYLASAYGLKQVSVSGVSTEEEPSAKQLAEVAEFAKRNNIKYIFFESLVSPKLSETIAREVGAQTLVLNPLEGLTVDEINAGKNYFTEMEANLVNLRLALECQ